MLRVVLEILRLLLEKELFRVPAVIIGDRQVGREHVKM